jgi:hypothetical protein
MRYANFLAGYYRLLAVVIAAILFLVCIVGVLVLSLVVADRLFKLDFGYPWWIDLVLAPAIVGSAFLGIVALRVKRRL